MKATLRTALLLLGLFLAAWMPRVLALDTFVTTDERKWLTRSANFYQAISHADFAATFQREHPGVTVMWAGTLGFLTYFPTYAQVAPGQFAWENEDLEEWLSTHSTLTPLQLLAAGRWWIALGIALAIMVGYFPLRRLFGAPAAALATLFVAWDPFFIALSRQLHPDGLVSSLIFLALLLFLSWLYGGQKHHYLVASGIVMGLAWLTKIPAIFLVPIAALLVTGELIHRRHHPPITSLLPGLQAAPAMKSYTSAARVTVIAMRSSRISISPRATGWLLARIQTSSVSEASSGITAPRPIRSSWLIGRTERPRTTEISMSTASI